ncbi:acyltransferase [Candidatus Methanoperedens nitratireducens]|uniref:Putative acetyltransferase n=1 Tax=Candidatus Methanoperedens nitratireducens TaxID=1392998 RepID=A0A284VP79_9EURY|nr:acyltransferase [Candidatus Methanoperedens nitroreducens]SNQ61091.1 putative acetyltransferase [Candidatus Methanoperedens nitroreducens]
MNEKISRTKYGEKYILRAVFNKVLCFIAMLPIGSKIKIFLYSLAGVRIGKNCFIASYVLIDDQYPELITIEDNVTIAYRAALITHDDSRKIVSAITLKKKSWIGSCAIILPGVIVGENAVVGAGATITKDVLPKTTVISAMVRVINKVDK